MTDLPNLNLTKKQKQDLKTVLYRLNWVSIMNEAVKLRPGSWADYPVREWRNASDCVSAALIFALEKKKILLDFKEEFRGGKEKW